MSGSYLLQGSRLLGSSQSPDEKKCPLSEYRVKQGCQDNDTDFLASAAESLSTAFDRFDRVIAQARVRPKPVGLEIALRCGLAPAVQEGKKP